MSDFDLSRLNDKDFEHLIVDLLGVAFNVRIERFKPGRDLGIDGRYYRSDQTEAVIQCKHWMKSGYRQLVGHLKKSEAQKVKRLQPSRYFFVTSIELSRKNKEEIQGIFAPWIHSPSDVFGQEDVVDLLARHPEVVSRHYKLWFASSAVLRSLLNASIKGRSEFRLREAVEFSRIYVPTTTHFKALQKLETLRSIVLTGAPGVGKSTMAEQLALYCVARGYELFVVATSIDEAEAVWDDASKQVFYFDDFLGRNYLFSLQRNEDSHVVNFMRRVARDPQKRFIITSRTTILNQGKALSDVYRIANLERSEYEVRIDDLSMMEKARILYSHIWNTELTEEYVDAIYKDKRYRQVVTHQNFNPRLIAFFTDRHKLATVSASNFWDYVQETLNNPADIWRGVYEAQLTELGRLLVRLTVLNAIDIDEARLLQAAREYLASERGNSFNELHVALKIAVGSTLNRTLHKGATEATISVFDPSLGDFVVQCLRDDTHELTQCLVALCTMSSLENLVALRNARVIADVRCGQILASLADRLLAAERVTRQYKISLADAYLSAKPGMNGKHSVQKFVMDLLNDAEAVQHIMVQARLLETAIDSGIVNGSGEVWSRKLASLIEGADDHEEFVAISGLLGLSDLEIRDELTPRFVERYVETWTYSIQRAVGESGILDGFVDPEEVEVARGKVQTYCEDRAADLAVEVPSWELRSIEKAFDYQEILERNWEACYEDDNDSDGGFSGGGGGFVDIDDLFDRG